MWFSCHADSGLLQTPCAGTAWYHQSSGAIIDWVETALKCHDSPDLNPDEYLNCDLKAELASRKIFRRMLHLFDQSDVVLGDRGFCSYANLALLVERGAHAVMRAHQMRQLDYRQGKGLG